MRLLLKLFFTIILCHALFSFAKGQVLQWQRALGGSAYDQGESVVNTFDGGFVAAGISTSTDGDVTGNQGFGDFWVVKTDAAGNLQWERSYGGSADDGAFSIQQTADSGFVIVGSTTSVNGDVTFNHGQLDYWMIKLDATGNLQWQKSYGGSLDEIAYDVAQTNDMGFVIVGYTNSNDGDISSQQGFEDFWIVKTDSTGSILWQNTFGGTNDERAFSVQQTSDLGYVVGGFTKSNDGDVTNNHGDYDFWIVKLDSTGILQWQKTFGGTKSDQAKTIRQTSDNSYVVGGFTASSDGDVSSNHGFADLWLIKLDSAGTLIWENSLGGSGVDQAYQVKEVYGKGFIIAGSSYSLDGDVTGNHGGTDCWIIRTDSLGSIMWEKSLGGSSFEEAYSVNPIADNGYIICGGTLSTDGDVSGNHGDFDYWLLKLTDEVATNISTFDVSVTSLNIIPTVCKDNIRITYLLNEQSKVVLEIYTLTGEKVATIFKGVQEEGNHAMPFDLPPQIFSSGLYFVKLSTDENVLSQKLIKY